VPGRRKHALWLGDRCFGTQPIEKLSRRDNRNPPIFHQIEQMAVAADDDVCHAIDSTSQHYFILRIIDYSAGSFCCASDKQGILFEQPDQLLYLLVGDGIFAP